MSTWLITGGCGFIGSNLVRHLLEHESSDHIINLDKLTYAGNPENLRDIEGNLRYEFIQGDICDERLVYSLIERSDHVVHLAAETHVDRSIEASDDFIRTNVMGTRVLLDSVLAVKRDLKFLHFSTDEVYGAIPDGEFNEDSPFRPTSPYAASKAAADLLVQAYWKTHKIPCLIARGCNNFGPRQYPEKVIPLFITNLIEGKKVPLYSRGENSREWMYVNDTCRAICLLFQKGRLGEAYNVGSGFETTNLELTRTLLRAFGAGEEHIAFVKDRPAHDLRYKLNSTKIKRLGFAPTRSFSETLGETIDWYRRHDAWWKTLKNNAYTLK